MKTILIILGMLCLINIASANYTQHFDTFYGSDESEWSMLKAVFTMYENTLGASIFWGVFLTMPFLAMWIKQQSVILPTVIMLIGGSVLFPLAPPEYAMPVKMMLVLGITGLLWHIFIKQR